MSTKEKIQMKAYVELFESKNSTQDDTYRSYKVMLASQFFRS